MFFVLSDKHLLFPTSFSILPAEFANSLFPRLFPTLWLLFTSLDNKRFLGFVHLEGISGCLWFSGTQLHFKAASCASQGCFRFTGLAFRSGSQPSSSQTGRHLLSVFQQIFSVSVFLLQLPCLLWLLPSDRGGVWGGRSGQDKLLRTDHRPPFPTPLCCLRERGIKEWS